MVGDGSIPPPKAYRPVIPIIGRSRPVQAHEATRPPRRAFANPFLLLLYPDVALLLFFNALCYSEFYAVTTTISTLFQNTYPFLSETATGLCFLAIGGGCLIGGVVNGEVLDLEYRRAKRRALARIAADPECKLSPEDVTKEEHFPIEQARLRLVPPLFAVFVVSAIGYGWCLKAGVSIAGPLVLQIISEPNRLLDVRGTRR